MTNYPTTTTEEEEIVNINSFNNKLPTKLLLNIQRNKNNLKSEIQQKIISNENESKQTSMAYSSSSSISSLNEQFLEILSNEPLFEIGECFAFLFGELQNQKYCQINDNINLSFHTNIHTNQPQIKIQNSQNKYIGQGDKQLMKIFLHSLQSKAVHLKGKIIPANLSRMKKKISNLFVHKLQLTVHCKRKYIPLILENIKNVKKFIWISKTILLKYFMGENVSYKKLEEYVIEHELQSIHDFSNNSSLNISSFNMEQLERNFLKSFESDIIAEDLEGIDANSAIVETQLLQHQRIGLEWMMSRELFDNTDTYDDEHLPPFYTVITDHITHEEMYKNILTGEISNVLPNVGYGGILADDMGLGKTLQIISLIAGNTGFDINESDDDDEDAMHTNGGYGPSLVICPLTVMGNWTEQIEQHCKNNAFSVLEYHGPKREKDIEIIKKYDIIITTYDIIASEYNDENTENREQWREHYGCGLQYIDWYRIILDEAHKIRSRKTRTFKACNALVAKSRWACTGTPVQNRLDDLYSLFSFLKLQPICNLEFWNKFIIQPLKCSNHIGFDRLQLIMKALCLRRTKETCINGRPIINLPSKNILTKRLVFNEIEHRIYSRLINIHKEKFRRMRLSGDGNIMRNFSSVLCMLLRLRQCCAHTLLIPKSAFVVKSDDDVIDDINYECSFCGREFDFQQLIISKCKHVYCKYCYIYEIEKNDGFFYCILCGEKLYPIKEKEEQRDGGENEDGESGDVEVKKYKQKKKVFQLPDVSHKIIPSSKMQALIDEIKNYRVSDEYGMPDKAIVFSQWTSVLDILGRCLDDRKILYERLDGSMQRSKRERAMENFKKDPKIPVFLMSLKAGNLGINMTCANKVYMMDPWWNPATEDQAIDRVYRLGQKRDVTVVHFVIKDSVEEKIVSIQERKRKLISSALGSRKDVSAQDRKQEWLNDLKDLFGAR